MKEAQLWNQVCLCTCTLSTPWPCSNDLAWSSGFLGMKSYQLGSTHTLPVHCKTFQSMVKSNLKTYSKFTCFYFDKCSETKVQMFQCKHSLTFHCGVKGHKTPPGFSPHWINQEIKYETIKILNSDSCSRPCWLPDFSFGGAPRYFLHYSRKTDMSNTTAQALANQIAFMLTSKECAKLKNKRWRTKVRRWSYL